jgi:serralysin
MTPLDTRANIDFRQLNDIRLTPPSPGPSADAESGAGSVHTNFGGNLDVNFHVQNTTSVGTTGDFTNQDINGILSGSAWNLSGGETITFSFPTKGSFYGSGYGSGEPGADFTQFTAAQQDVVRYALNLIHQYTGINFAEVTETKSVHATMRFAGSSVPSTSWAYYPDTSHEGGDVWLGNVKDIDPIKAGYAFDTIMHEIGHAIGLKHGHQDDGVHGVLPTDHDSTEWSLMTYHSFVGGDEFYRNADGSGNQSYMIDDISAMQYMYGANFTTNGGNTTYTWSKTTGEMFIDGAGQGASETNKVYEAIWDGNGIDTYDLSNYTSNLQVDLNPGEWSTFDPNQLADLDAQHPGDHLAHGNIANAHLFEGDKRSLIENAIGGSGDDTIVGNTAKNALTGGDGDDTLSGAKGNDTMDGGAGEDSLSGGKGKDTFKFDALADSDISHSDVITDLDKKDTIDLSAIDADSTANGDQAFTLVSSFGHHAGEAVLAYDKHDHQTTLSLDVDGDAVADMVIAIDGKWVSFEGFAL